MGRLFSLKPNKCYYLYVSCCFFFLFFLISHSIFHLSVCRNTCALVVGCLCAREFNSFAIFGSSIINYYLKFVKFNFSAVLSFSSMCLWNCSIRNFSTIVGMDVKCLCLHLTPVCVSRGKLLVIWSWLAHCDGIFEKCRHKNTSTIFITAHFPSKNH